MTDDATRAQIDAALPNRSTWLSANAGSGKTRVLTDRVALLLLQGVMPQRILCLTYTKAAASEMQNRLFRRLGTWAMMPDDALTTSLLHLGVARGTVNSETLRDARRLFAKAIETPGGLKIQTIHSFCAALLRRFPLEAEVSPGFAEIDDRSARLLRADVLEAMAQDMPDAVRNLAAKFTGEAPDALLAEISRHADLFDKTPSEAELRQMAGLPDGVTADSILRDAFDGGEAALVKEMIPFMQQGKASDQKLAQQLPTLDLNSPSLATIEALEPLCLVASGKNLGKPKAYPPTADAKKIMGSLSEQWADVQTRIADARPLRIGLASFERNAALHGFAKPFLARMAAAKQQRSWLDFDDLIRKARKLLTDPSVASWVLFRLDGGIDHILVDEAQDTSPVQWEVIRLLSEEFFSGESASDKQRTIFVVGDKKQSIYSFQGADPAEFDRLRDFFDTRLAQIQAPFANRELLYSFRSAAPVLRLVDAVFTEELRKGMGGPLEHKAFKSDLPGRVDLWDWIEKAEKEDDKPWYDPVDTVGENHHSVLLANRIADHILRQTQCGQITQIIREDGVDRPVTRAIRASDFLILVQSRSAQGGLFHEIIRACKERGLPMAGADRLRVGGEMGVRDLMALLAFLETPQNDLALAEVMRSPLGCVSESDLFSLAYGRPGLLWDQLDARAAEFPELHNMLTDLRDKADFERPYELLERALTVHGGRERLLDRLGLEAEDGITALLDQALQYEQSEAPSLTGFLTWLATDDVTIKRQMDSGGDFIRVMTVHGAKGLEAPIVILPQTGTSKNEVRDDILDAGGNALWKARATEATELQNQMVEAKKDLQFQERMRLLYVALTRAESWLIICGSGDPPSKGETWYEISERALESLGGAAKDGVKLRLEQGDWPQETAPRGTQDVVGPKALPGWARRAAEMPVKPSEPLSPSNLGGAKTVAGRPEGLSETDAKARGTMIHLLLETLANKDISQRQAVADRLLARHKNPLDEDLLAHAARVLDAPELAHLWTPDALVEAPISAPLPELGGAMMSGTIDRLILTQDTVLAVDFKSNRMVPDRAEDTPEGVLRQLGAYASALRQIYPEKRVETAVLWTETAQLVPLPHDIVRDALRRAHTS
jgi:ATP-dependent helicase/nuclease subunit A